MTKAAIVSISGLYLSDDEKQILSQMQPVGVSLFSRNISNKQQLRLLVNEIKEVIGDDVIVAVDQEGGRVRRLAEPEWKSYASQNVLGKLSPEICKELSVEPVDVIAVAGHDTQSAITAVPSEKPDFAFISCGTWSLFGTEPEKPIVNEKSRKFNVTNEGGYNYATAFLKNICGLWLIQESRRQWIREGKEYSYAELEEMALASKEFACFIDPDAPEFVAMGDIPSRIKEFCRKTGQYVPETVGEIVRCIYESLALKYRNLFEGIEDCTNKKYEQINIMGGGTKDKLLCKMTADSCLVPRPHRIPSWFRSDQ